MKSKHRIAAWRLFFGAALLRVLYWGACRDSPPPDVSDLLIEEELIPPEANAYNSYMAAVEMYMRGTNYCEVVDDYMEGKQVDEAALESIFDLNSPSFDLIHEGNCRDSMASPLVKDCDADLGTQGALLPLGKLMLARARFCHQKGQYPAAFSAYADIYRFAENLHTLPGSQIEFITGIMLGEMAQKGFRQLSLDPETPEHQLEEILRISPPGSGGSARALTSNYFRSESLIKKVDADPARAKGLLTGLTGSRAPLAWHEIMHRIFPRYLFQPNKTLEIQADQYRRAISAANFHCAPLEDIETAGTGAAMKMYVPNGIGRAYCNLAEPVYGVLNIERSLALEFETTRFVTAIQLYKRRHGDFPEDLRTLPPETERVDGLGGNGLQ